jgi:vacuolar-type H+-ATPase subunit C/Vma6
MSPSSIADYAALHSRTRAMYSKLLAPAEWQTLYSAPDYAGLIDLLRDSPYGPYLQAFDAKALTSRRVVYEIKKHLTDAYLSLLSISPTQLRGVLAEMLRLYEVDNLKAAIRGIIIGESWDRVRHTLFPLGDFGKVPCEAMMASNDLTAAIEMLKGSVYYSPLVNGLIRYNQEKNLFAFEVALDLDYWNRLWKDSQKLSDRDRVHSRQLIGTLMDMNNLLWALRYRIYYQLSEEEIINYTLPFGYHVRDEQIRLIASGGDISSILINLYPDFPISNEMGNDPQKNMPFLENWLLKQSIKICKQNFTGFPFHAGIPIAYLHLLAMEIEDLTVLLEAKSMEIPFDRFGKFLIFENTPLEASYQR